MEILYFEGSRNSDLLFYIPTESRVARGGLGVGPEILENT